MTICSFSPKTKRKMKLSKVKKNTENLLWIHESTNTTSVCLTQCLHPYTRRVCVVAVHVCECLMLLQWVVSGVTVWLSCHNPNDFLRVKNPFLPRFLFQLSAERLVLLRASPAASVSFLQCHRFYAGECFHNKPNIETSCTTLHLPSCHSICWDQSKEKEKRSRHLKWLACFHFLIGTPV